MLEFFGFGFFNDCSLVQHSHSRGDAKPALIAQARDDLTEALDGREEDTRDFAGDVIAGELLGVVLLHLARRGRAAPQQSMVERLAGLGLERADQLIEVGLIRDIADVRSLGTPQLKGKFKWT